MMGVYCNNYRSAATRGLCYYYFPPCGNSSHFEPPRSVCVSVCQYLTENVCRKEWADALQYFDSIKFYILAHQIDIVNCSNPGGPLEQFLHCCSNAGVEEYHGQFDIYADLCTAKYIIVEVQHDCNCMAAAA